MGEQARDIAARSAARERRRERIREAARTPLPDCGGVGLEAILARVPHGRSTVYEKLRTGELPRPKRVGRRNVWPISAARELIRALGGEA